LISYFSLQLNKEEELKGGGTISKINYFLIETFIANSGYK